MQTAINCLIPFIKNVNSVEAKKRKNETAGFGECFEILITIGIIEIIIITVSQIFAFSKRYALQNLCNIAKPYASILIFSSENSVVKFRKAERYPGVSAKLSFMPRKNIEGTVTKNSVMKGILFSFVPYVVSMVLQAGV